MTPQFRFQERTQKNRKQDLKDISVHPTFATALFTMAKKQKQPRCTLMAEWINKMGVNYYSATKRNEVLTHGTTRMDCDIMPNEVSQIQNKRHARIPPT